MKLNPLNSQLAAIFKEASRVTRLTSGRHEVPAEATPDLRDTAPKWNYTPDGLPVGSMLLPQDLERGVDHPMRAMTNVLIAFVILGIGALFASGAAAITALEWAYFSPMNSFIGAVSVSSLILVLLFGLPVLMSGVIAASMAPPFAPFGFLATLFFSVKPRGGHALQDESRDEVLYKQSTSDSAAFNYVEDWADVVRIRNKQGRASADDKSAFVVLGTASGHLARHDDPYAPDANTPVGLTLNDLSMHLAVLGKTGTGKTVVIRKIVKQVAEKSDAGMFVVCGKGTLPAELVGIDPGYVLLNPETSKLALFQGMTAVEVTDALAVKAEKEDAFFYSAARTHLKNSAVLLKALADNGIANFGFTPRNLLKLMNANGGIELAEDGSKSYLKHGKYREAAIKALIGIKDAEGKLLVDAGGMATAAFDYFEVEWQKTQKADKTMAGVMMHVNQWLEPLFSHELIAQWANCETGEDITTCLTGKRIGLDVPATKYGQAAAQIIANLTRQRLYAAMKKRGNDWRNTAGQTAVLILLDEMHLVWQAEGGDGMDDNSMVSIARSLGGMYVVGTQSIDEMESRFGSEKTLASLGNFRNFLCYEATQKTMEYASTRIGAILRPVFTINGEESEVPGLNVTQALGRAMMEPVDTYGRLGRDLAGLTKKLVKNSPLRFVIGSSNDGIQRNARDLRNIEQSPIQNKGRATYLSATADELGMMLEERFAAIAILNRAGAPRRDVVIIDPAA